MIIGSESLNSIGEGLTLGKSSCLKVFGARRGGYLPWPRADVVNDWVLEPRDAEVEPLGVDLLLDAADPREDDGAVAALDWK